MPCLCQKKQTKSLLKLLDKGSTKIEKRLNVEKMLKGLQNLKILMQLKNFTTLDVKLAVNNHDKNLIKLDSSGAEEEPRQETTQQ